jgi:hypothetical protein
MPSCDYMLQASACNLRSWLLNVDINSSSSVTFHRTKLPFTKKLYNLHSIAIRYKRFKEKVQPSSNIVITLPLSNY